MSILKFKGINFSTKKLSAGIDVVNLRPTDFYNVCLKVGSIPESEPVVSVGDVVKEGTLIAKAVGAFGINIFSPVSGKVLNIYSKRTDLGESNAKHILILNDYQDEKENLKEIESISDMALIGRLREAGLIDYNSGKPAYLKYAFTGSKSYNSLLVLMDSNDINSSLNETLTEFKMEEVVNGAKYYMNITNAQFITFVFSKKNAKLAKKLQKHILETKKNYDFRIKFIPNAYPLDNPFLVAKILGGKKMRKFKSFLEAGISVENAESCYNFCRAVEFNRPLTAKVLTIDGDCVIRKGNYIVPNGTSYEGLLSAIGVEGSLEGLQLINGNLMCGLAEYDKSLSISMISNSILLHRFDKYTTCDEMSCISCGKCQNVCPVFINPKEIDEAVIVRDVEKYKKCDASACINCGCCSYVCPSNRHLTQRVQTAKNYVDRIKGGK